MFEFERINTVRLFHVSEEDNIQIFVPRLPSRSDLDKSIGLVWAIDESRLPNFFTPRDCPRVTYHIGKNTTELDKKKFFTSSTVTHTLVIESRWLDKMKNTILHLYEFNVADFILQDDVAGYYVATTAQIPMAKYQINDLFSELLNRNIEIRIVDNLWDIANEIKTSSLNWSLCRMGYAQPR
jgi:hypothetical protein